MRIKVMIIKFVLILLIIILGSCKNNDAVNNPQIQIPTITTATVTNISSTTAICGGTITSDGGATVTLRGVCWSTGVTPTINDSKTTDGAGGGSFASNITGLQNYTTYYVRAYATNSTGTGYGMTLSFTSAISDIDGNVYHTVTIGTQVWMVENLKTTTYRNGDAIPNITDNISWSNQTTGAYCNYDNNSSNTATYGRLYNWYAVNDSRNIAPPGWHVATDAEWTTLTTYLGGENVAGGKLKEAGLAHWSEPITGATNETGFTALPGGYRNNDGTFYYTGYDGYWWSSTLGSTYSAWYRNLNYYNSNVLRNDANKKWGFSVRCLRD